MNHINEMQRELKSLEERAKKNREEKKQDIERTQNQINELKSSIEKEFEMKEKLFLVAIEEKIKTITLLENNIQDLMRSNEIVNSKLINREQIIEETKNQLESITKEQRAKDECYHFIQQALEDVKNQNN